ncbi:MAG: sulfite exporter TauE/SafE family protein [Alphaproteobacteria bacterium]|nr:sulfite exporter TauE/SafE family protein [Alphaproteobacteria bacterium]
MNLLDFLPLVAVLVATGCVAGVLAGLLGVGGGIVIVPVLFTMLGLIDIPDSVRMHVAVGTSLASIVVTSIASARSHHKRGAVDTSLLKSWGAWIFAGSVAGTLVAGAISGAALSAVFAVVALLVAAYMTFTKPDFRVRESLPPGPAGWASGSLIGGISAMMGIGGGTLCVPFFNACGFPVHRAVGTAAAIGLIIAVPAALGFIITGWGVEALPRASVGHVNLIGLVVITPFTTLTAPLGVKLAHRLSPRALKLAFAVFLFATAVRMFIGLL